MMLWMWNESIFIKQVEYSACSKDNLDPNSDEQPLFVYKQKELLCPSYMKRENISKGDCAVKIVKLRYVVSRKNLSLCDRVTFLYKPH